MGGSKIFLLSLVRGLQLVYLAILGLVELDPCILRSSRILYFGPVRIVDANSRIFQLDLKDSDFVVVARSDTASECLPAAMGLIHVIFNGRSRSHSSMDLVGMLPVAADLGPSNYVNPRADGIGTGMQMLREMGTHAKADGLVGGSR
jgi:hypothetical protein